MIKVFLCKFMSPFSGSQESTRMEKRERESWGKKKTQENKSWKHMRVEARLKKKKWKRSKKPQITHGWDASLFYKAHKAVIGPKTLPREEDQTKLADFIVKGLGARGFNGTGFRFMAPADAPQGHLVCLNNPHGCVCVYMCRCNVFPVCSEAWRDREHGTPTGEGAAHQGVGQTSTKKPNKDRHGKQQEIHLTD